MTAAPKWPFEVHRESYRQGNWKPEGVATRYELEQAIDRLLDRGKVVIVDGLLMLRSQATNRGEIKMRLALDSVRRRDSETARRERWAAEDERLRIFSLDIQTKETRTRKARERAVMEAAGSMWESALRGSPRSVTKYILRELRENGPRGYEELVTTVNERGGLEWVLEEPREMNPKTKKRARSRHGR